MKTSATHSGHCQACGRLQKLPLSSSGPKLSLHGYSVTHGYFSGTCVGSKESPFELSCELVKRFIQSATSQLANLEAFQTRLRQKPTEAVAWFNTSKASRKGFQFVSDRRWEQCDILEEVVTYENGTPEGGRYSKFSRAGDTAWMQVSGGAYHQREVKDRRAEVSAGHNDPILDVAWKANRTYAKWLEHEADSLRRYIVWQTERVQTWKPAPLFPVTAKDKQGFKPTEPAY